MEVYWFNPDNDLALACGATNYTPTRFARQFAHDLQLLPCWIAQPGDCVVCDDTSLQPWVDEQGLDIRLVTPQELPSLGEASFRPWGWSAAMRRRLELCGVEECLLPSSQRIEQWRQLSHRRTSIAIHQQLRQLCDVPFPEPPVELSHLDDIQAFAAEHPGCFVKEPWSGSGHGIYRAIDPQAQDFVQRCTGALRRQGSMLCEAALDRMMDFAVEVECCEQAAHFEGFSIFESDFHLQYSHGIVDSTAALHKHIASHFPAVDSVVNALLRTLNQMVAPCYTGHLGVDMLLFHRPDGTIGINPCVEMNLRTTMGTITCHLGERHGLQGRFVIKGVDSILPNDIVLTPSNHSSRQSAVIEIA